ncbi:MAG TPA: KH domain-containing protein, partial [archaeon]|nr:KH domain-containing protein [archaeon]
MKENPFIRDKLKKIAISNYLKEKLKKAGFIDLDIEKSANTTKVVIYALKPSFVIGKKGTTIRALTDDLEKEFGLSRVRIEIGEIP